MFKDKASLEIFNKPAWFFGTHFPPLARLWPPFDINAPPSTKQANCASLRTWSRHNTGLKLEILKLRSCTSERPCHGISTPIEVSSSFWIMLEMIRYLCISPRLWVLLFIKVIRVQSCYSLGFVWLVFPGSQGKLPLWLLIISPIAF